MIDRNIKRCLGQMAKGVQVVGASHNGVERLYTSHWVCQVSFEEPAVMASISPKHDTHAALVESGKFSVSVLAGDQVEEGQYFSYPGHKFDRLFTDYLDELDGLPIVRNAIAWLVCEVDEVITGRYDHDLVFGTVTAVQEGRLDQPALTYSSRQGWKIASEPARAKGESVRDVLLARLEERRQQT